MVSRLLVSNPLASQATKYSPWQENGRRGINDVPYTPLWMPIDWGIKPPGDRSSE